MEHQDTDSIWAAQNSHGPHNTFVARTNILPACSRKFSITKGPSLPAICAAPATVFPSQLSESMNLHGESRSALIADHLPVQFTLQGERKRKFGDFTFAVALFVRSIDLAPDLEQLHWSLFGRAQQANQHSHFSRSILIRGWFQVIGDDENAPPDLRNAAHRECIIVYLPQQGTGWLGEVAEAREVPTSGVVKDLETFLRIVRQRYAHGFVESCAPDGITRWCRVSGGEGDSVTFDAKKKDGESWKYYEQKSYIRLRLVGVEYIKEVGYELVGDAFLCSDGTMLHTYHYSKVVYGDKFQDSASWNDGYYSNRFYVSGSPMIPQYISDSFSSEMPAWFFEAEEARNVKTWRLA